MAEKKKKRDSRAKANRLISKYLTEMATKEDALLKSDGGEDRMCTRAEALAQIIWEHTLGFEETLDSGVVVKHSPNLSYMKVLLERMEGKVQDVSATKSKKSIADRIKETTKSKINDIAESAKG
ncbi:hypothetical protein LCGC14_0487360 [marine sediment metagenome]|uniref:Uncharacterized protein n=1 Tax=marine sediment metagenome TaxID=412755 RepID=A0A0F9SQW9_9ZZZZ